MHVRSLTNKINVFVPVPANPSERVVIGFDLLAGMFCTIGSLVL